MELLEVLAFRPVRDFLSRLAIGIARDMAQSGYVVFVRGGVSAQLGQKGFVVQVIHVAHCCRHRPIEQSRRIQAGQQFARIRHAA